MFFGTDFIRDVYFGGDRCISVWIHFNGTTLSRIYPCIHLKLSAYLPTLEHCYVTHIYQTQLVFHSKTFMVTGAVFVYLFR